MITKQTLWPYKQTNFCFNNRKNCHTLIKQNLFIVFFIKIVTYSLESKTANEK